MEREQLRGGDVTVVPTRVLLPFRRSDYVLQHITPFMRCIARDRSEPPSKRAASLLCTAPCPPGSGPFVVSSGFYHRFAFALPFGLASTRAGVWQCRPAVTLSGRSTSDARFHALAVPSFSGPLHQPGAGIPAGTDEMFDVRHLLTCPPGPVSSVSVVRGLRSAALSVVRVRVGGAGLVRAGARPYFGPRSGLVPGRRHDG